jgi:hypothetical protein
MNEAEAAVRKQMKNQSGTDMFAQSARISAYNKLMGLDNTSAYRKPDSFLEAKKPKAKSPVPKAITIDAKGKVDLSFFNR